MLYYQGPKLILVRLFEPTLMQVSRLLFMALCLRSSLRWPRKRSRFCLPSNTSRTFLLISLKGLTQCLKAPRNLKTTRRSLLTCRPRWPPWKPYRRGIVGQARPNWFTFDSC
eukprot:Lithocolla_globosa_v1_NODE_1149_length_2833_cov_8.749460.p2 type:complete len:112 gc:universal NODE_1149_length_2833_cov_8.749460:336-671(+)